MKKLYALMIILLLLLPGCLRDVPQETASNMPQETENTEKSESEADIPTPDKDAGSILPGKDAYDSPLKIIENPGKLDLHLLRLPLEGEDSRFMTYSAEYSGRYSLYLTFDRVLDDNGTRSVSNQRLYIADCLAGAFVYDAPIGTDAYLVYSAYTADGGYVIYAEEDGQVTDAYLISDDDGVFTVEKTEYSIYPKYEARIVSPDGRYTVFDTVDDRSYDGGLDLISSDAPGAVTRILENSMLDEVVNRVTTDLASVTGYAPEGFIDNTTMLYRIIAWEGSKGWGFYDCSDGENEEILDANHNLIGVFGDRYFLKYRSAANDVYFSSFDTILSVDRYGNRTTLIDLHDDNSPVTELAGDDYILFVDPVWFYSVLLLNEESLSFADRYPTYCTEIFSHDFKNRLAKIEYPANDTHITAYENSVTVVFAEKSE